MTIVSDACTINIISDASRSVNDTSRRITDGSRVMLQIVASLYDRHNDYNMFRIQGPM
jgi:hypothetical protein